MIPRTSFLLRTVAGFALAAVLAGPAPARLAAADAPASPAELGAAPALEALPAPEPSVEPAAAAEPAPPPAVESEPAEPAARKAVRRGELVTIGNSARLRENEVASEMVTIFGNAVADGRIDGECVTILGNVTVNGRVGGELVCIMGDVTLGPRAEVHGQLVSVGGRVKADPQAQVFGEKVELPFFGSLGWFGDWIGDGLLEGRMLPHNHRWAWVFAGAFLLITLVFAAAFRRPVDACVAALETKPMQSFLNGILAFILVAPVTLLLVVSVVGLLLVPFFHAALFIGTLMGITALYRHTGAQLGLAGVPLAALVVGNVLFALLFAVPFLGLAVWFVVTLFGVGIAITATFEHLKKESRSDKSRPRPLGPGGSGPGRVSPVAPAAAPAAPAAVPGAAAGMAFTAPAASAFTASPEVPAAAGAPFPPAAPEIPAAPAPAPAATMPPLPPGLPQADVYERVGLWPRTAAMFLDLTIIGFLTIILGLGFPGPYTVLVLAYLTGFWTWRGTSLGGIVLNLRIARLDGTPVTFGVALTRALGCVFSAVALGLGFIAVAWSDERQSWHDMIAGTTVVRIPRGTPLL